MTETPLDVTLFVSGAKINVYLELYSKCKDLYVLYCTHSQHKKKINIVQQAGLTQVSFRVQQYTEINLKVSCKGKRATSTLPGR